MLRASAAAAPPTYIRKLSKMIPEELRLNAGEVIAGRADGFVSTKALQSDSRSIGFTAGKMLVLRASKPIGTVEIFFKVSNRDPKLAGTILEAWERGLKRIEKSGELARLRDYYGITEAKTLSASKSVE